MCNFMSNFSGVKAVIMTSDINLMASLNSSSQPMYEDELYYDEFDIQFHLALYKLTVPIMFGLVAIVGFIGNLLVILVILRRRHMHTTVNISLLNLAFCDVIFVSICVPVVAYHYMADNWLLGDVMCKLLQFLVYVTVYVTVFTLVLVSTLRYLAVVHDAVTVQYRTCRNVIILITLIWVIMLIGNCPVLIVYRVKVYSGVTQDSSLYYYCGMSSIEAGQGIFLAFFVLTYVIPLSTIAMLYMNIVKYLKHNRNAAIRMSSRNSKAGGSHRRDLHTTKVVIKVVAVFGACWLPLHVHLLLAYFGVLPASRVYEVYRVLTHVVAYANACLNPLIYTYASKDFRLAFRDFFRCSRDEHRIKHSARSSTELTRVDMLTTRSIETNLLVVEEKCTSL